MDKIGVQKGFVYPFTLIVCLLVVSLTFIQVNLYLSEKQFVYEKERLLKLESLIQVSIQQLIRGDLDITFKEDTVLTYEDGTVVINIGYEKDGISNVTVHATLLTGHQRQTGFSFNWETQSVEHYWEVLEL